MYRGRCSVFVSFWGGGGFERGGCVFLGVSVLGFVLLGL